MKLRIVKHRNVARDALQIFVRIGQNNLDAARRFLRSMDDDFKRLAENPGIGAIREFSEPRLVNIRSLPVTGVTNYLIFYRRDASTLQVLRVVHGARDLERALTE